MKARFIRVFLLTFLSLFSVTAFGQGTVTGVLVDSATGENLVGAAAVVKGTSTGTASLFDGTFSLKVPAGKQTLLFSYIGYIPSEKVITVKDGQTLDLGNVKLKSNTVGIDEVKVVSSFARDRQTPVALSTIQPQIIQEKLGTQEFPEILKSTPSVYATKQGGGFGDSRINLRGFDSNNIGVLINGVPVNDMENGHVYWSDWAGLSDVTQTMQVQRGLGASKLAISSVGGTINIITQSTDAEKSGSAYAGIGNDGMRKYKFTVSTGLMDNGWAVTLSGAHTYGDGYIRGTNFDGYSYFLNIAKQINDANRLSFTLFGAPQWHNQRGNKHFISTYRGENPNIPYPVQDGYKYNSDFGYRDGKVYGGAYGYNEYNKPQASLNWYWKINDKTFLSTAAYASVAKGGGRRVDGLGSQMLGWDYKKDEPYASAKLTPEGYYDYDAVMKINQASHNGSQAIVGLSVNSHQWYGILSTLNTKINKINLTAGIDGRYYIGKHAKQVTDLLGGDYFLDKYGATAGDINRPESTPLKTGDYYAYYDDGIVRWLGLYGQGEYVTDNFSAFLSASVSSQGYNRRDYFLYTPGNQMAGWINFLPYSVKGGANYNINKHHNVYVNGGYFTRAPYFNIVFPNYTNEKNKDAKYERVLSYEVGYGYTSSKFDLKLGAYRTKWMDKGLSRTIGNQRANISGLNALHQGIELTTHYRPVPKVALKGMVSVGDWKWLNNVSFKQFDDNNNLLGTYHAYIKDVHVGNSAQTTAAISAEMEVLPKLKLGIDGNYYGRNYADFDPSNRVDSTFTGDAWKMPNSVTFDLYTNYKFKMGPFDATIYGNVNNLFDNVYITDATDGTEHNAATALVWYGFGRTWSCGLKVRF